MKNSVKSERKRNRRSILLLAGLLAGGIGIGTLSNVLTSEDKLPVASDAVTGTPDFDGRAQLNAMSQIEDTSIYDADVEESVIHFYVTVRYGSEARGTNHTFSEVNNVVRFADGAHVENDVYAEALVQVGDETGPVAGMFGYGETESNAIIRVRGSSSTAARVKSYKLSLDENAGTWRGQSNIALNKHAYEPTRLRNKLYFDLLKEIPEVPSVRTQFVVLHIKDETSGATEFVDYGLYTQAEVPTKKYLRNHGMDADGYLYKVIAFNWETNEAIKNTDDPDYDAAAMETVISNRGREDNEKLIKLVEAVNDKSLDINEILGTYFDRENYVTWLAYNILMGNMDTTMQNYYLYSPLNGDKWYFIPWDGDASLTWVQRETTGEAKDYGAWECGISNYWNILLHQRYLKYASNREELAGKVEDLYQLINESLDDRVKKYDAVVSPYVLSMPDLLYLGATPEERAYYVSSLKESLTVSYEKFRASLVALMPFWSYAVVQEDGNIVFSWGEAFDFQGKTLTYDLTVSRYPDMREPVLEANHISTFSYTLSEKELPAGKYYIRMVARSSDGRSVGTCNKISVDGIAYPGVLDFVIE